MQIPIIGVSPLWDDEKDSMWMLPGYFDGIKSTGGLPVMLPLALDKTQIKKLCGMVDGLLFTGGPDVSPGLYGEVAGASCGPICKARDDMETMLFTEAVLGAGIPAFGICRGLQLFNSILGGNLYQDIPTQLVSKRPVGHQQGQPDGEPSHDVMIERGSPLHMLLGAGAIAVNSTHHQGVRELSTQLECMATAEDGLIEAAYMPNRKFVWAVQWHPERMLDDPNSHMLFEAFINACSKPEHPSG